MSIPQLWTTKILKIAKPLLIFLIIFSWIFSGWPPIWNNPPFPSKIQEAYALNKIRNWNFNGDATGWQSTTATGTDVCGSAASTAETGFETWAYTSTGVTDAGSWQSRLNTTSNNVTRKGRIKQTFAAPGTGPILAKGRFSYAAKGVSWNGTAATSWIRLDVYNSTDATFVANLGCVSFNSNQASTTTAFSGDTYLTGNTTYTMRVTTRIKNTTTDGIDDIWVDNVIVNFAPVGLASSAPTASTTVSLSWTASSATTSSPNLHATTPYRVYRSTSATISTSTDFLANSTTNSYTDDNGTGNTTYYYAATDVDTNSVESPVSATTTILTKPAITPKKKPK